MMTRWSIFVARFATMASIVVVVVLTGCQRDEPIVKQRVQKTRSGLSALQSASPESDPVVPSESTATAAPATVDRMVVGMYELDDATWFFKINGSAEQIAKSESEWKPFLESVKFVDGKPDWKLPENWSRTADKPMRFATLAIGDSQPPLELAISNLGAGQDLLLNVNRWRGQMGLSPLAEKDLSNDIQPLKSEIKSALLFDVTGKAGSGGMMPPFANRAAAAPATDSRSPSIPEKIPNPSSEIESKILFESPAGWQPGTTNSMVPVRLEKRDGDKLAQISIIPLPAAVNEWKPNAERWAGQAEMPNLSAEELTALTSAITVSGLEGQLIKLVPSDSAKTSAIIAAMIKQNEIAWFVKLSGDKKIVGESETAFSNFLKSLKFP